MKQQTKSHDTICRIQNRLATANTPFRRVFIDEHGDIRLSMYDTDDYGDPVEGAKRQDYALEVYQVVERSPGLPVTHNLPANPRHCAAIAAEQIAAKHLDIPGLTPQGSDSLDFHDVACWDLQAALVAAYMAGRNSVPRRDA